VRLKREMLMTWNQIGESWKRLRERISFRWGGHDHGVGGYVELIVAGAASRDQSRDTQATSALAIRKSGAISLSPVNQEAIIEDEREETA
jgi:hypothetical protein